MSTSEFSINPHEVTLAASCTLREAAEMKSALLGSLDEVGDIRLNAARVVRIDTAGLQLLVAFLRDLADAGRCIEWREVSLDLRAAARCLGLEDILLLRAG